MSASIRLKVRAFLIALSALMLSVPALAAISSCETALEPHFIWDEFPEAGEVLIHDAQAFSAHLASFSGRELRVLWWNVEAGNQNRAFLEAGEGDPLSTNLALIADLEFPPDVIVLGEYHLNRRVLSRAAERLLTNKYQHGLFVPYNDTFPDYGIRVLSRLPFASVKQSTLSWIPRDLSGPEREAYVNRFTRKANGAPLAESVWMTNRPYIQLDYDIDGQKMSVVPVHLVMPWNNLIEREGMISTVQEIVLGRQNPIVAQIRDLLRNWDALGCRRYASGHHEIVAIGAEPPPAPKATALVTGDFNISPSLASCSIVRQSIARVIPGGLPDETYGYQLLKRRFRDAFGDTQPATFPAASSPYRGKPPYSILGLKLDHAFGTDGVDTVRADVLPLRGSDHYPVFSTVMTQRR